MCNTVVDQQAITAVEAVQAQLNSVKQHINKLVDNQSEFMTMLEEHNDRITTLTNERVSRARDLEITEMFRSIRKELDDLQGQIWDRENDLERYQQDRIEPDMDVKNKIKLLEKWCELNEERIESIVRAHGGNLQLHGLAKKENHLPSTT